jgi:hypothetical protein
MIFWRARAMRERGKAAPAVDTFFDGIEPQVGRYKTTTRVPTLTRS